MEPLGEFRGRPGPGAAGSSRELVCEGVWARHVQTRAGGTSAQEPSAGGGPGAHGAATPPRSHVLRPSCRRLGFKCRI